MRKSITIIYLLLFFSFPVIHAQDMSEQQKVERCENNRKRITELEGQSEKLARELSYYSEEKIATARAELKFLIEFRKDPNKPVTPDQQAKYQEIYFKYK